MITLIFDFIDPREIMVVRNCSVATAYRIWHRIQKTVGKPCSADITVDEYCFYSGAKREVCDVILTRLREEKKINKKKS